MPSTTQLKEHPPQLVIKRYVTKKQALELYDVSEKTIERYIVKDILPVVRDRHGHIKIDLDILEQVMREKEIPPHPLKQQILDLQKRIEDLEREVKQLRGGQQEHTTGRENAQERLQAAMSTMTAVPSGEINVQAAATLKQLLAEVLAESGHLRTRKSAEYGLAGTLKKRGLPEEGTMRLVDFAKVHKPDNDKVGAIVYEIKKAHEAGEIAVTIYQREGEAQRNKQEWWITREQHLALIAYWQQHGRAYTECPICASHEGQQAG